ncbi:MAG: lysophospholipid acyltransferase family protein [Nitrospirota bacterium]
MAKKKNIFNKANIIENIGIVVLFFPFRWIVQALSWGLALKMAEIIANIHYLLPTPFKRQIYSGISTIFLDMPAKEIKEIVRLNLVARYYDLVIMFLAHRLDPKSTLKEVPYFEGEEHLKWAIKQESGIILLGSHLGNLGLLICALGYRGYDITQYLVLSARASVISPMWLRNAVLKIKIKCHSAAPSNFIYHKQNSSIRPVYDSLRDKSIFILIGDGVLGKRFTDVDFIGYRMQFSLGPAIIASKTESTLLPIFIIRQKDGRHRVIIKKPIIVKRDDSVSIRAAVSEYANHLERYVIQYPDQWLVWPRLNLVKEGEKEYIKLKALSEEAMI